MDEKLQESVDDLWQFIEGYEWNDNPFEPYREDLYRVLEAVKELAALRARCEALPHDLFVWLVNQGMPEGECDTAKKQIDWLRRHNRTLVQELTDLRDRCEAAEAFCRELLEDLELDDQDDVVVSMYCVEQLAAKLRGTDTAKGIE